jgi:phage terminase small subunit
MQKLTAQQESFVDEYIKRRCKNATQAAINAGYSKKTAAVQGCRLLNHVKVLELIEQRKSALRWELQEEFIFDALTARKVMFEILSSEFAADKDKITVARDFLDRAGFAATEKVEAQVSTTVAGRVAVAKDPYADLTTEELKKLLKMAEADEK